MFPFLAHHGLSTRPNQNGFVQEPNWVSTINCEDSIMSSASKVEKKSTEPCKSHKEAERRRRQRINAHLSTLRTLLPSTTKTDKASLLAEVVHHVKELRRQAADVARKGGSTCSGSEPDYWPFPGESDEFTLACCDRQEGLVKATLCCEDRPGLNGDMSRAFGSVRARPVRAEMMTVGGRSKSVVVMEWAGGGDEEMMGVLRRALKDVVENRASNSDLGRAGPGNKRARVCELVNESDDDLII
ncbi:hypothetical protein ACOSQ2_010615 [Xanthoceras sorbifolium]|uniref:BHLH domain-containing protein n=1 Tax=Xanthoceras sorbifolium TaxID=99658 RepID=A0ABQ8HTU2_9ROSI|nr:hypothetical protein JRO89_XS07G0117700 [Xanthoceras sorbifolium]